MNIKSIRLCPWGDDSKFTEYQVESDITENKSFNTIGGSYEHQIKNQRISLSLQAFSSRKEQPEPLSPEILTKFWQLLRLIEGSPRLLAAAKNLLEEPDNIFARTELAGAIYETEHGRQLDAPDDRSEQEAAS